MTVDGSVRELRHQAKNALRGEAGLSREEQLDRLDTALEALAQAREIVANREVVNGPAPEESEEDFDADELDDEDEEALA